MFWRTFEQACPQILGALLDVVSTALQDLPHVTLDGLPRMADFALWSCAAAPACGWTAQDFLDAYQGVRDAAYDLTLEASPVAPVVRRLVEEQGQWEGTAGALLVTLETLAQGGLTVQGTLKAGNDVTKQKTWPKNGRALSNALRRLAPTLRAVGVDVQYAREAHTGNRLIVLKAVAAQSTSPPGTPGGAGTPPGQGRLQGSI